MQTLTDTILRHLPPTSTVFITDLEACPKPLLETLRVHHHVVISDKDALDNSVDAILITAHLKVKEKQEATNVTKRWRHLCKPEARVLTIVDVNDHLRTTLEATGFQLLQKGGKEGQPDVFNLPTSAFHSTKPLKKLGTSWRNATGDGVENLLKPLEAFAGISRISSLHPLAGFSIPVFSASRPRSKISISSSAGKGVTEVDSRLSALFEAAEVAAAEFDIPHVSRTVNEIKAAKLPFVAAEALATNYKEDEPINWVAVRDYETAESVFSPAAAVTMLNLGPPFVAHSNGLASDTTFHGAILHGVLEVLERHACSLALVNRDCHTLDLTTVDDAFIRQTLTECKKLGLKLEVKDVSDSIGMPCYRGVLYDPIERDSRLMNGGAGCYPDSKIALRRAVTEIFQSRAVAIAGAREDLAEEKRLKGEAFDRFYETYRFWYEPTLETRRLRTDLIKLDSQNVSEILATVLETSRAHDPNLGKLYYYTFPAPHRVWVVRSIIENAELFCIDRDRLGPQIRAIYEQLQKELET